MESQRLNSTCCGVPVQTGCFIFAVINAVICSLASLGSLGFLGFILSIWFDGESRGANDMVLVWLFTGMAAACCIGSAIALSFAVLLCVGLNENNPRYLMVYLIFGIFTVTVSASGAVAFIAIEFRELELVMYALIPLGVCFVYSCLLVLVHRAYRVISENSNGTHKRLLNVYDC